MNNQKFKLNIAMCDDEPVVLQQLQDLCSRILSEKYTLAFCSSVSPEELLSFQEAFDIAILDVLLLKSNGIQLAQNILAANPNCRILFISGHVNVVSDVYDVPHFCFILKDQLEENLPKFLMRAADMTAQDAGMEIKVKLWKGIQSLPLSQIVFMERRGHWTYITMSDGTVLDAREKLSSLLSRIGSQDFIRSHISYIVNMSHVSSLEGRTLILEDGHQIPVSLPHEQEVRNAFFRRLDK